VSISFSNSIVEPEKKEGWVGPFNIELEKFSWKAFYSRFSLKPKGKYNIQVCMGTACYVKGAEKNINKFKKLLGIEDGGVTKDGMFSFECVRCIGACGLAPAAVINGEVYGKLQEKDIEEIIKKYKKMEEK
jgi:NADH:ubiquinone oxidoreductase subunit E